MELKKCDCLFSDQRVVKGAARSGVMKGPNEVEKVQA